MSTQTSFEVASSRPRPCKVQTPRPATTILARRAASAKYRERNKEELRYKAKERMARLRVTKQAEAEAETNERRRLARERSRVYRVKCVVELVLTSSALTETSLSSNGAKIAERKREKRDKAFWEKHGYEAYAERQAKRRSRREATQQDAELRAWDEQYRCKCERDRAERSLRQMVRREAAESLASLRAAE
ncbi:hypothetical protein GGX14DRAFT_386249 [Mycena pura]|uniref:Uncharacterized protein n=1 Tax=Mycena pura TaxID=153505 RepID=A0AAD7E2K0_9AGAR|nr:hypothetical protein GGX14DRAFT_386249 [Mycena pura]